MTLPAFKAAGTGSLTAPAWPTHVAGDFALLVCHAPSSSDAATISTPSGWTLVPGCPITHGRTTIQITVFYRFATSSSETAPSLTHSLGHVWGTIITYTGVNTANPIHSFSGIWQVSGPTNGMSPGLTTFLDDCLIVNAGVWLADDAGPYASAEANSALGSLTERYDAGTTSGSGGGVVVYDGTLATAASIGFTKWSWVLSTNGCSVSMALQAADKTFSNKTRTINTRM